MKSYNYKTEMVPENSTLGMVQSMEHLQSVVGSSEMLTYPVAGDNVVLALVNNIISVGTEI